MRDKITTEHRIRTLARAAEDIFWDVIAAGAPEAVSGDLPPGIASEFAEVCHRAVRAWFEANVSHPPQFDVASFSEDLPKHGDWSPSFDHPGCLAFHHPRAKHDIHCTPDHDKPGFISFEVFGHDGCTWGEEEIAFPLDGRRTVDGFMAIMRPLLDRWTPREMTVTIDITGMTEPQVAALGNELIAQCEANDEHPAATVVSL